MDKVPPAGDTGAGGGSGGGGGGGGSDGAVAPQPQRPPTTLLQQALHTVEQAWWSSAEHSHCFQLPVQGEGDEEIVQMHAVRLRSGHLIPTVGLGVYRAAAGGACYAAVLSALRLGYRHVDTAQIYGNEEDVGRALRDSGVPRDEVFITSKVWGSNFGYEAARASLRQSLRELGCAYVDLMLLHAPFGPATRAETWRALEDAAAEGEIRSIGVSNFGIPHLEKLMQTARVAPAVNQIELHPWLQRREEVAFCQKQGIVLEAYSPLVAAEAQKLGDPLVGGIAQRLGVSPAQVLIRWSVQKGFVPLPKSTHPDRQRSNLDVFRFQLSDADMEALDSLESGLVTGWDPIRNAVV